MSHRVRKTANVLAHLGLKCWCLLILACTMALLGANAQAGLVHDPSITTDSAYLNFAGQFPSVGWFGTVTGGVTSFGGSATLVHPNFALMSAHQVLAIDNNVNSTYEGYRLGFSDDFFATTGENKYADELFIHPNYSNIGNGPDLALLYFESPFTSVSPAVLYNGSVQLGDELSLVGFGQSGTPGSGLQPIDGKKRAGSNYLNSVDSPFGYMEAYFRSPGEADFNLLGILGTPGDSGGGWFVDVGGEQQLAGVSSFWGGFPGYGGVTAATYVGSAEAAWINQTIQSTTAVPEPSSFLFLGMLASAIGAYKGLARFSFGRHGQINSADAPLSEASN